MIQEHIHSAFCVSRVIAVEQSSVANAINDALDAREPDILMRNHKNIEVIGCYEVLANYKGNQEGSCGIAVGVRHGGN